MHRCKRGFAWGAVISCPVWRAIIRACARSCICALTVGWAVPAWAQAFESVGTRAQGMGGAFVAVADDATATWWNPAGLASGAYGDGLIEYGEQGDRGRVRGVAVAYPALGLSYYRLAISRIRPIISTATTAPGREDREAEGIDLGQLSLSQFGATAGQSFGNHLVIASTLKLTRGVDDTKADLDLGAMARFGLVRVGLSVRNVREPTLGSGPNAVTLERQARVGLSMIGRSRGAINALALAVDADVTTNETASGQSRRVAGGFEAWTMKRRVAIRAGVGGAAVGLSKPSVSGGLSLALRTGVYVEGAITETEGVRSSWATDVRVTF